MKPLLIIIIIALLKNSVILTLFNTVAASDVDDTSDKASDNKSSMIDDTTSTNENNPNEETEGMKSDRSSSKLDYHTRIYDDKKQPSSTSSESSTVDSPTDVRKGQTSTFSITGGLAQNVKECLRGTKKNMGKIKNASIHMLKNQTDNLKLKEHPSNIIKETSTLSKDTMDKNPTVSKDMENRLEDKKTQFDGRKNLSLLNSDFTSSVKRKMSNFLNILWEWLSIIWRKLHLYHISDFGGKRLAVLNLALQNLGERYQNTLYDLLARPNNESSVVMGVLAVCLLGTSIGFRSYLYFVSVGQSVCIGLVSLFSLVIFHFLSKHPIPTLTTIQSSLTLLWSIRLTYFLLHREYVNWPEQHLQIQEVERRAKTKAKISIWWTCAIFYATMVMPCVYRLKAAFLGTPNAGWGIVGKIGIGMQCFGLVLETVADHTKAVFKVREGNRDRWCQEGVWGYSTHPNYMGEITYWVGVYLGGVGCFANLLQWTICTMGLLLSVIVMKSAIDSLDLKQWRKYGYEEDFRIYRQTHGIFGPSRVGSSQ